METTLCNVCHQSESELVYTLTDYLLERPNVQSNLVRCLSCGLIYQNPRPTLEEMGQHYPDEYDVYQETPIESVRSWLLRKELEYGLWKHGKYITNRKKNGRLLDIGCATGIFLNWMKNKEKWETYGIEINPNAAEIARERYKLNVKSGTLDQAAFSDGFFDAVTLWDVLEHVHDPRGQLSEIHRILKKDGLLVCRVPNYGSLDSRLFGAYWAGLDAPRHLYVFTISVLEKLLRDTGFSVIYRDPSSGSYPAFLLSLRFYMVARRVPRRIREPILKILSHPVCRLLSFPLFSLEKIGSKGPQVVVVAVRS